MAIVAKDITIANWTVGRPDGTGGRCFDPCCVADEEEEEDEFDHLL